MKPKIERGEIWWVNLDPTRGAEIRKQRPCVVVSANALNRWRATPVVVPLSASPQDAPPVVHIREQRRHEFCRRVDHPSAKPCPPPRLCV